MIQIQFALVAPTLFSYQSGEQCLFSLRSTLLSMGLILAVELCSDQRNRVFILVAQRVAIEAGPSYLVSTTLFSVASKLYSRIGSLPLFIPVSKHIRFLFNVN